MMKKGKKWRRKENGKKKCSWLDLNSASLGCKDSVYFASYSEAS